MSRAPKQLCVVTIGIDDYLLPMADGARIVELLGRAERVERRYTSPETYAQRPGEPPRVELTAIRGSQIVPPRNCARQPAARPVST